MIIEMKYFGIITRLRICKGFDSLSFSNLVGFYYHAIDNRHPLYSNNSSICQMRNDND